MPSSEGEFALIDWFRRHTEQHVRLPLGIGDDTAVVKFPTPTDALITVDMLIEGTHFTVPPASPQQVGHKALAVNLSDIAAMAGRPLAAVVSVALPRSRGPEFAQQLHQGLHQLARQFDVAIAGGDTNVWDGPLVISVTLLGEAVDKEPVRRSGARVGDWIMATGEFGGSLTGKHLTFQPRVNESLELYQFVDLHAMIDVSDGLAIDLHHILDESQVAAILEEDAIPISDAACQTNDDKSPVEHALSDGEDFELLFTVDPEDGGRLLSGQPLNVPISHIGEIVSGTGCEIRDSSGGRRRIAATGWEHRFENGK